MLFCKCNIKNRISVCIIVLPKNMSCFISVLLYIIVGNNAGRNAIPLHRYYDRRVLYRLTGYYYLFRIIHAAFYYFPIIPYLRNEKSIGFILPCTDNQFFIFGALILRTIRHCYIEPDIIGTGISMQLIVKHPLSHLGPERQFFRPGDNAFGSIGIIYKIRLKVR